MNPFKSSLNTQKKEVGPNRSVLNNRFSSVTLNEMAMKARDSSFNKAVNPKTDINPKGVRIKNMLRIYESKPIMLF